LLWSVFFLLDSTVAAKILLVSHRLLLPWKIIIQGEVFIENRVTQCTNPCSDDTLTQNMLTVSKWSQSTCVLFALNKFVVVGHNCDLFAWRNCNVHFFHLILEVK
jgi:hypothetical protein